MLCPRLYKPCLKWLLMIPTIIFITKCTQNYSSKTNYRSSMSLPLLPNDFLDMDDAIFFIETNSSEIELKPRLTCAIERVAKVYPKRPIIVILNQQRSQCVPAFLSQLPNVHFRSIEIDHFVQGSAVEALWKSGKVKSSIWSLSNISNLLRFLVVFKFGGLYLDHDVIALKPMPENETNFICLVRPDRVASAIFQLNKGHPLLKLTLERMVRLRFFQPYYNKPILFFRQKRSMAIFGVTMDLIFLQKLQVNIVANNSAKLFWMSLAPISKFRIQNLRLRFLVQIILSSTVQNIMQKYWAALWTAISCTIAIKSAREPKIQTRLIHLLCKRTNPYIKLWRMPAQWLKKTSYVNMWVEHIKKSPRLFLLLWCE